LTEKGLADVVPLHQLLRSASDWRKCEAEPFSVPPASQWPALQSVLELLQSLRKEGALGRFEVVSAHRGEALNRCAQGAPRSAHFVAFAVDLIAEDPRTTGARLCRFWQTQGQAWRMGLAQYPSGRIHIDTHGFRTWGCLRGQVSPLNPNDATNSSEVSSRLHGRARAKSRFLPPRTSNRVVSPA
jgi:uncharacterized protein YcbK (DUF882 family)